MHAARNLPSPEELLTFIGELPFRFSLLIDSTGGYHGYILFKELWILNTSEERQQAALLLRRFQRTIQTQAAAHGWKVDSTADLARVLRPPGTSNHKSEIPKPVTIAHEDGIRYNPVTSQTYPGLSPLTILIYPRRAMVIFQQHNSTRSYKVVPGYGIVVTTLKYSPSLSGTPCWGCWPVCRW